MTYELWTHLKHSPEVNNYGSLYPKSANTIFPTKYNIHIFFIKCILKTKSIILSMSKNRFAVISPTKAR